MIVYRGFACLQEALNVLQTSTVGGITSQSKRVDNDMLSKINIQKASAEGAFRIVQNSKVREGFIEYTTDLSTAINHGTLCVICGVVDDLSQIPGTEFPSDIESGVFLYLDTPIKIYSFCYGYFYKQYKCIECGIYGPINENSPEFFRIDETTKEYMDEFLQKSRILLNGIGALKNMLLI